MRWDSLRKARICPKTAPDEAQTNKTRNTAPTQKMKRTHEENAILHHLEWELDDIRTRMQKEGYPLWLSDHELGIPRKINHTWNENIKLVADLEAMYLRERILEEYTVAE